MSDSNPLISKPTWVSADRPRFFRDWTRDSKVYITTWGDRVHLFADCPGTHGFGADPTVTQVKLSSRACTARKACRRCFGDFWSGSSIEELNHFIEVLHGRIDDGPDRRARSVIAEKITRRYGTSTGRVHASPDRVVSSRRDPKVPHRAGASARAQSSAPSSKAEAKRQRDRAAAAALGISVKELKARRQAENESNRQRKLGRR